MKQLKSIFLVLVVILFAQVLFAQVKTISGVIKDKKGQPIEGAAIRNKTNGITTPTAKDGSFSIQANESDILTISSIGFESTSVKANSSSFNIVLQEASIELQEVVLLGSRKGGRVKTESAVPVDIININQAGVPTAKMDLTSVLNYVAPSFNYNKQSGADGADHVDLGTLRGLGPDQTLVLINGKRRHQTAFVALFGTKGRGNSGVDLNAFPQSAVDKIEILRDGASAQYGSDAIAGVINLSLKKDVNRWSINTGWSGYYDNKFNSYSTRDTKRYLYSNPIDGGTFSFSANNGVKIGKKGGFINVSFDYLNQAKTFRQVADTNVWTNPNAQIMNSGRRAFGDGSVSTVGTMFNMEIPTNATTTFYAFGG
ncbi:MAG: TonB-dependent receptor plug domain-containing protein, partial [Bacteroidota bacterium]